MKRIENIGNSVFGMSQSAVDGNRLYSILLDTRASKVSESMFDIADTLLKGEKNNAKAALDQLWSLKKTLQPENETGTIDLLIKFYQDKMDILRNKENHITKVSKESRSLLEDKRKRDSDIAMVKQEINDCDSEVERLKVKLEQLRVKEQELTLIESQLKKELQVNANEIVNGLYEIILAQQRLTSDFSFDDEIPADEETSVERKVPAQKRDDTDEEKIEAEEAKESFPEDETTQTAEIPQERLDHILLEEIKSDKLEKPEKTDDGIIYLKKAEPYKEPPFPKSIVKTTKGRVIGEYYYNPKVYKNKRHYIYNSGFLNEQLSISIDAIIHKFDGTLYSETVQMVQDAQKRLNENPMLHIEVSVNEILNEKSLKDLLQSLKIRRWDEVQKFCSRLGSKISALGNNYINMLVEQMERYSES